MKLFKTVQLMLLITCIPMATAFADHNEPGANLIDRLKYDTQELNSVVQYSYLRYPVKVAVAQFAAEVSRLNCLSIVISSISETPQVINQDKNRDHLEPMDHNDGGGCSYQLQRVQQAFYPVERYLYDTYSDQPRVYQLYQQTRQDLYALLGENRSASRDITNESTTLNLEKKTQ